MRKFQPVYSLYRAVNALHGTSQRVGVMLGISHTLLAVDRLEVHGRTYSLTGGWHHRPEQFSMFVYMFALLCFCLVSADPALSALYRAEPRPKQPDTKHLKQDQLRPGRVEAIKPFLLQAKRTGTTAAYCRPGVAMLLVRSWCVCNCQTLICRVLYSTDLMHCLGMPS